MKDDIQERWNEGYYSALNGAKIIRFIGTVSEEFGTGFPQFLVKLSTGEIIEMEVSKDPEGNGGGFLMKKKQDIKREILKFSIILYHLKKFLLVQITNLISINIL